MPYQDVWSRGAAIQKGYRECAARYELIRSFCQQYDRPFTVCDIGANMCYFGIRLTEDFPDCTVMAFESDRFEARAGHLRKANASRVMLLKRRLGLQDLHVLSTCCHFDLVLVLSVFHHLGGVFADWLAAFRELGDHLIAEFAVSDSRSTRLPKGYRVPYSAELLGTGESHIQRGVKRPLMVIRGCADERP